MVNVLIYSSKEIYDNASYEGRAEAHIVAYRIDDYNYQVVKNRVSTIWFGYEDHNALLKFGQTPLWNLRCHIEELERDEWKREIKNYKLCQEMKNHPYIELSKNAGIV